MATTQKGLDKDYFGGGKKLTDGNKGNQDGLQTFVQGKYEAFTLADSASKVITTGKTYMPAMMLCKKSGNDWLSVMNDADVEIKFNSTFGTLTITNNTGGQLDFELMYK